MHQKWWLAAWLLMLIIGLVFSVPVRADGIILTVTPTPRSVTLFEDDFATYSGRWQQKDTPKASVVYGDAALDLQVVSPGVSVWSVPDFDAALHDYRAEVTANFRGGGDDAQFGFVLDYQDDDHFYALLTTSLGVWQFLRRQEDEWIDLAPADAVPLERETGDPAIRLRAEVVSDTVSFYIDDQLAGSVTVEDGLSGAVFGLIAHAGRGYVDVSFDDFIVTALLGE